MHNKKYIIERVDELRRHNPLHNDLEGKTCYLAYLNKGERGWILYNTGERFDPPHRLHTSEIRDIAYNEGQVIVTTMNTRYVFKEITD